MESPDSVDEGDDLFDDAIEVDGFPFHDCSYLDLERDQPEPQPSSTTTSANLRRRKFYPKQKQNGGRIDATFPSGLVTSPIPSSLGAEQSDSMSINERTGQDSSESVSPRRVSEADEEAPEASVVTAVDDDRVIDADSVGELHESEVADSSLLITLAAFVIKVVGFQFNLFISMVAFPFWCFSTFLMLIMNPISIMALGRDYLIAKFLSPWNWIWGIVNPFNYGWFGEHKSIWELAWKFSVGLFWSIYVCSVLLVLLVSATLVTGFIMRYMVVEPIVMEERLNFDYTKNSPVAYMPIVSCGGLACGQKCKEMGEIGKSTAASRIIPPNHKLFATVKLTLPESDYNRNLGMFQVRIELLSANGDTLTSSSRPCMLLFKSEPIRLFLTMLKIAPLISGYISESQTVTVELRGLVEGNVPSTCLKVVVEQRAQFHSGAGIPEIYDALLILGAELPLLKRLLWNWRRTLFVWTTMVFFVMELLLMLICCRAVFLPRTRPR